MKNSLYLCFLVIVIISSTIMGCAAYRESPPSYVPPLIKKSASKPNLAVVGILRPGEDAKISKLDEPLSQEFFALFVNKQTFNLVNRRFITENVKETELINPSAESLRKLLKSCEPDLYLCGIIEKSKQESDKGNTSFELELRLLRVLTGDTLYLNRFSGNNENELLTTGANAISEWEIKQE